VPVNILVKVGDVLDEHADVLICPANPWLNMSGGVNGEILRRGGESIQDELKSHLQRAGCAAVGAGTVVRTDPGPLPVKKIIHAVAIDPFYGSSVELVVRTLEAAFGMARSLGARRVSMPMLATGYGPLDARQFASSLSSIITRDWAPIEEVNVVVRRDEDAEILKSSVTG
jgi:O-acetyl-ADP-ribose deacetylase (regulator of RNase III)